MNNRFLNKQNRNNYKLFAKEYDKLNGIDLSWLESILLDKHDTLLNLTIYKIAPYKHIIRSKKKPNDSSQSS